MGAVLEVGVLPPAPGRPGPIDLLSVARFPALIDTGASGTCILLAVAQAVGLRPKGKRRFTSATHTVLVDVYEARLVLPFRRTAVILPNRVIAEFVPGSCSRYQVLLGRDVICRGLLALSPDGHFSFAL